MQAEISGNVLNVTGRQVGRNNNTIFDVEFSDGNTYSTWDDALANEARRLQGQSVTATVSVEQSKPRADGKTFTNYNLLALEAAAGVPSPAPTVPNTVSGNTITGSPPIPIQPKGGMDPEREQKIVKQSSLSTAFNFVGSLYQGSGDAELDEATQRALSLARELFERVMNPASASPVEQVAAGVNGDKSDGIPW